MAWTKSKTVAIAGLAVVCALTVAFAAWRIYHPAVNDRIFRMGYIGLRRAPDNVLILRRTHFATSRRHGDVAYASAPLAGKSTWRMMGYKASFAQVIGTAYSCSPNRIALPPDAPKDEYDFLVTVPEKPNESLQAAVKRNLGWTAKWESRTTDVLALKIKTPNAPALRLSANNEKTSFSIANGKLRGAHVRLGFLIGLLGNAVNQPVIDETAETTYYDFSADFDWNQIRNEPNQAMVDKFLNQLGLELRPDTTSMSMLVVEKAH